MKKKSSEMKCDVPTPQELAQRAVDSQMVRQAADLAPSSGDVLPTVDEQADEELAGKQGRTQQRTCSKVWVTG